MAGRPRRQRRDTHIVFQNGGPTYTFSRRYTPAEAEDEVKKQNKELRRLGRPGTYWAQ